MLARVIEVSPEQRKDAPLHQCARGRSIPARHGEESTGGEASREAGGSSSALTTRSLSSIRLWMPSRSQDFSK